MAQELAKQYKEAVINGDTARMAELVQQMKALSA